jgi:mannose-1-phosphate guanylyltransferase
MELYAVIMAGGVGSRFWPRSREKKPKQLIRIFGDNTMIQDTVKRLEGLVENDKILIVTNKVQKLRIKEQLPQIPPENIIDEPFGKNTAACIGLASIIISKKSKDAVTLVLPSDHLIKDVEEYQTNLRNAAEFACQSKGLVTIGIKPTKPETGYGYIQFNEEQAGKEINKVLAFAEKPNLETAKSFIEAGDFLWNSGMFIWRVDAILKEIKKYLPDLFYGLEEIKESIDTPDFEKVLTNVYGQLKSISIDYGVMENSSNVYITKSRFDWSDVGSWEAVYELSEKDADNNAHMGDVYTVKTTGSYIYSPRKFTAVIGLENTVVINSSDALLICNRDMVQDVKLVVDYLKMNQKTDLI